MAQDANRGAAKPEGGAQEAGSDKVEFSPLGNYEDYQRTETNPMRKEGKAVPGGKLTGEELKRRVESGRARQAETRMKKAESRASTLSAVRIGATALMVVGTILVGGFVVSTTGNHDAKVQANNEKIASIERDTNQINADEASLPSPDAISESMTRAFNRATEVKDKQMAMGALDLDEKGKKPEDPESAVFKYGKMVEESKQFYSNAALTGGSFLPQGQWYRPYELRPDEDGVLQYFTVPNDQWTWSVTPLRAVNRDGFIPVLWEARFTGGDRNGVLLAWVEGKYNPDTNKFSSLKRGLTNAGSEHLGAEIASASERQSQRDAGKNVGQAPEDPEVLRQRAEEVVRLANEAAESGGSRGGAASAAPAPAQEGR